MIRRLVPLVVAITMAFAPVALGACEAMCAAGQHADPTGSEPRVERAPSSKHSCHHAAAPESEDATTTMTGVPHACGHSDDLPPTSLALAQLLLHAPAVLPSLFELTPPPAVQRAASVTADTPDTIPIPAPVPLRV